MTDKIKEAKDAVAKKHGYEDWFDCYQRFLDDEMTSLRLSQIIDEAMQLYAISQLEEANKEIEELKRWKKEQLAVFSPLLDYGQNEMNLALGTSIVDAILKQLKASQEQPKEGVISKERIDVDKLFTEADNLLMNLRVKNLSIEKELYDIQAILFQIQDAQALTSHTKQDKPIDKESEAVCYVCNKKIEDIGNYYGKFIIVHRSCLTTKK